MRIIHVLNHVQEIGNGIVNVAVDLACLQAKAGHQVVVASKGGEYEALLTRYGASHVTLDQTRAPLQLLRATRAFLRLMREFKPDIVHAHMMTGAVLGRALSLFGRYRLVSTVHNEFQRSAGIMGWADRVIAVSDAVSQSMARRGVAVSKLRVVRNGTLGSPRQDQAASHPQLLSRPSIATVAGLYHRKGIAELIAAFALIADRFPAAHLYLIGNGPDREAFEAQAQATRFSGRIHFEGFQRDPAAYLKAVDIFVLASRKDPFPLVLPEAREAGCAIVASRVDGIPEALEQGEAGALVEVGDIEGFAAAIAARLADPALLLEWRRRAGQNLDWLKLQRVHDETMAVYREIAVDSGAAKSVGEV